jgi:hypothetical protein
MESIDDLARICRQSVVSIMLIESTWSSIYKNPHKKSHATPKKSSKKRTQQQFSGKHAHWLAWRMHAHVWSILVDVVAGEPYHRWNQTSTHTKRIDQPPQFDLWRRKPNGIRLICGFVGEKTARDFRDRLWWSWPEIIGWKVGNMRRFRG